jgi:hypothetical protein
MMNCLILETCQIRRGEMCESTDRLREEGGVKRRGPRPVVVVVVGSLAG